MIKEATLILGIIVLAACIALPKPFEHKKHRMENGLVFLSAGGAVRVEMERNVPEFIANYLSEEAVKALAEANIPASADPNFNGKYILKGFVTVEQPNLFEPEQATFVWSLMTAGAGEIGSFEQTIQGDESGWLASDPVLLAIIAKDAGRQLAVFLQPDKINLAISGDSTEFSGDQTNPPHFVPSFYLSEVVGAPGDGNTALLRSLKFVLSREYGRTAFSEEEAQYLVKGVANVSPPINGQSDVAITWLVTSGDGEELGKVRQNNKVPEGSLDTRWGQMGLTIANGAMLGIKGVVNHYNKGQR